MSTSRRVFGLIIVFFFILCSLMEVYLQYHAIDMGGKTYHRIAFFGWMILANLEMMSWKSAELT